MAIGFETPPPSTAMDVLAVRRPRGASGNFSVFCQSRHDLIGHHRRSWTSRNLRHWTRFHRPRATVSNGDRAAAPMSYSPGSRQSRRGGGTGSRTLDISSPLHC